MSATKTYFISGASRGLGFGYAKTLLASSPNVRIVAGARNPSNATQLRQLATEYPQRVHVVAWDVDDEDQVKAAASQLAQDDFVRERGIDSLIVNAGVFQGGHTPPAEMSMDDLRANFRTNVEGAIHTVRYLLPLLNQGHAKQIFFISSICGSMQGFYSESAAGVTYSMSKAALNMYGVKLARELGDKGFTVVLLHPGYVKTDMNKFDGGGNLTTEEAVTLATENVFLPATPEWNGRYMDYEGKTVPW
ncbi:hypothetical protein BMF94_3776 [Rhodotorula taiwanensis]|uniref:Uncharacterized protein n=1 Tax=Rhodotorula taiwanensis TaxID=741276 RepID=A0A2S5B9J2_9BASI|nr:hypothetical protein BMF94_3776 [Rhodotorula taiwanensis]